MKRYFNGRPRLAGALLLLIGCALGGGWIWPSLAARNGTVGRPPLPLLVIVPYFCGYGLMLLAFGPAMLLPEQKRLTPLGRGSAILICLLSMGIGFWLMSQFRVPPLP